jgi:uncharacterized membrane-anchored protein
MEMEISTILASPLTWLLYVLLAVTCTAYAAIVRWLRHSGEASQTPWLVAIGNSLLLLCVISVIGFSVGVETGITVAVVVFLANVFGGVPMIVEYVTDYTARRQRERRNQEIADMHKRMGNGD